MPANPVVENAVEPCRVCGSVDFNLQCPHCLEILLTSGQTFSERIGYSEPPAGEALMKLG